MNFLADIVTDPTVDAAVDSALNLEFNPMKFVQNLEHMGVGMLVIFVIIGIIILSTKLVNYLFSK